MRVVSLIFCFLALSTVVALADAPIDFSGQWVASDKPSNDGDKSEEDVPGGEQRGESVGCTPGTPRGRARIEEAFFEREARHLSGPFGRLRWHHP